VGTRGLYGFVLQGRELLTYHHFDSYPSCLGVLLLRWLRPQLHTADTGQTVLLPEVAAAVGRLRLVDPGASPTAEQREQLAALGDAVISDVHDWSAVLEYCQGDLAATLRTGYMIDDAAFAQRSASCEWGYVIDVDAGSFDVYAGRQRRPANAGRWACPGAHRGEVEVGEFPIQRVWAVPFAELAGLDDAAFAVEAEGRGRSPRPSSARSCGVPRSDRVGRGCAGR
jgi:hypothetical protein